MSDLQGGGSRGCEASVERVQRVQLAKEGNEGHFCLRIVYIAAVWVKMTFGKEEKLQEMWCRIESNVEHIWWLYAASAA